MLNPADDTFEATLRNMLPDQVFRDESDTYFTEPRGKWRGQGLVLAPGSTNEVAQIIRACFEARVGVVPFAGGTGLVGGQVMGDGPRPVVLSMERMTQIRAIYPTENTLVCDAGVVLANIQQAARDVDRLFALSLGSEGTARIGGLLSTNAGGVNVLRYGNARAQCLGLEFVTADGQIWNGLTRLRKDNTGYDLRDLIIGAEGTLGVITGAALKLSPLPAVTGAAMLAVASPKAALDLLALAQDQLGDVISGFELIHAQGIEFLMETGFSPRMPLDPVPEWSVLIDLGLPRGGDAQSALITLFEAASERELVSDGVIAQSEAQRQAFWAIRETIPLANKAVGSISSHDISLPLSEIPCFIPEAHRALAALGEFRVNCFGHLGDGNLHYNVFPPRGENRSNYKALQEPVQRLIHDMVVVRGGAFSAEHGVGRLKANDLKRYSDPTRLQMMRQIKAALDPRGIMNPGAVLTGSN